MNYVYSKHIMKFLIIVLILIGFMGFAFALSDKSQTHSYEINLLDLESYPTITDISEKYVATIEMSKNRENHPAPLKQISAGVALDDIKCNDKKTPVYKYNRIRVCMCD